jgi:hypothetical protein
LRAVKGDVSRELKAEVDSLKTRAQLDTDTTNALARAVEGSATKADLRAVEAATQADPASARVLELARQATIIGRISKSGEMRGSGRFVGGLGAKLERSVRTIGNPLAALPIVGGHLALGSAALPLYGAYGLPALGAAAGLYGGARAMDALSGARSPVNRFTKKFADGSGALRPDVAEAPRVSSGITGPKIAPERPSPWGYPEAPPVAPDTTEATAMLKKLARSSKIEQTQLKAQMAALENSRDVANKRTVDEASPLLSQLAAQNAPPDPRQLALQVERLANTMKAARSRTEANNASTVAEAHPLLKQLAQNEGPGAPSRLPDGFASMLSNPAAGNDIPNFLPKRSPAPVPQPAPAPAAPTAPASPENAQLPADVIKNARTLMRGMATVAKIKKANGKISTETSEPAVKFTQGETWSKGKASYTIAEVSPDGQTAKAVFSDGGTAQVHAATEIANGWAGSQQKTNSKAKEPEGALDIPAFLPSRAAPAVAQAPAANGAALDIPNFLSRKSEPALSVAPAKASSEPALDIPAFLPKSEPALKLAKAEPALKAETEKVKKPKAKKKAEPKVEEKTEEASTYTPRAEAEMPFYGMDHAEVADAKIAKLGLKGEAAERRKEGIIRGRDRDEALIAAVAKKAKNAKDKGILYEVSQHLHAISSRAETKQMRDHFAKQLPKGLAAELKKALSDEWINNPRNKPRP